MQTMLSSEITAMQIRSKYYTQVWHTQFVLAEFVAELKFVIVELPNTIELDYKHLKDFRPGERTHKTSSCRVCAERLGKQLQRQQNPHPKHREANGDTDAVDAKALGTARVVVSFCERKIIASTIVSSMIRARMLCSWYRGLTRSWDLLLSHASLVCWITVVQAG